MNSLLITVLMGIITLMLTIIGYFIVRFMNSTDKLADNVEKLQLSVSGMNAVIESIKTEQHVKDEACSKSHARHEHRLNNHAGRLDQHEKKITELDVKVNLKRK